MPNESPILDQARDPLANVYQGTADQYDIYLNREYGDNFQHRKFEWMEHYGHMQTPWFDSVLHTTERGIPRKEMNIAIVGPGMHPVGRDFGETFMRTVLREVNNIVVIDFSTAVVRHAMDDLISHGISSKRVMGMQFDITDGISTAYQEYIAGKLKNVETEVDLMKVTAEFQKLTMDELDRCLQQYESRPTTGRRPPEMLLRGGLNEKRSLALSTDGQPIPIHLCLVPMVMAGTGAAAEDLLWTRYREATSDPDRVARTGDADELQNDRFRMHQQIFDLIARVNITVASTFARRFLHYNPDARMVAVTDVNTKLGEFGELPRLYIDDLREEVKKDGIQMHVGRHTWEWRDEPEHSHDVKTFKLRKESPRTSQEPPAKPVSVAAQKDVTGHVAVVEQQHGVSNAVVQQVGPSASEVLKLKEPGVINVTSTDQFTPAPQLNSITTDDARAAGA